MSSFCCDCVHLHGSARGSPPSAWMCTEAINDEVDLVTGTVWPYHLCRALRRQTGPECPKFKAGVNCLVIKE